MNFGKYLSLIPFEFHFEKEPEWFWKIRSVTAEDELIKDQWWMGNTELFNGVAMPPAGFKVMIFEIARTFAGTNIPKADKPVEDGGKPILSDNASVSDVESILKAMPPDMVLEIWRGVGEINPFWGPAKKVARGEEEISEGKDLE